ncbi:MAG TPA: tRNA1(Val) (adenine(37)-N6)-methyltransferase [Terriglobales bacterium]|nr:tRNA1(Val) (adenine(37)-N6)-methyltransferase [Terriglobales bacterium]
MDSFNDTRETLDLLFQGKLQLYQRRKGYRISLDPILLGHFMSVRQGDRVMDLGTGNGILPLVLAHLHPSLSITGLELQEEMAARAARNIRLNGFDGRVRIACLDVCSVAGHFASESFDAVISNPPYRTSKSGRLSPDSERQIARHETRGTLEDFIHAAGYLLRPKGRFALIYIAGRSVDLVTSMRAHQIEPKCLRMVHSFIAAGAAMVLVEGVKGGKPGIKILPPLVVYNRRHNYTAEIRSLLSGAPMKAQAARRNE